MSHLKSLARITAAAVWLAGFSPLPAAAHGDLHERIAHITAQILTNQTNPELWLQRAELHRLHADFDSALTDLEKARQLRPDWPAERLELARTRFDMNEFSACRDAATGCLKLAPGTFDALILRARSHTRLQEIPEAIADYTAALSRTNGPPPLPEIYLERARLQAAQQQLDAAIRGLDEGCARLGLNPSLALPAIEYERQRGSFAAALARLEKAAGFLSPPSRHALRGEILLDARQPTEARAEFEAGLRLLKDFPPERRTLPQNRDLEAQLQSGWERANVSPTPKL